MRDLVGPPVAIGVLENEQAIAHLGIRRALGIIRPGSHPQAALGVPGHLHRIGQLRELLFTGEEVHLHPGVDGHLGDGLFTAQELVRAVGILAALVGGNGFDCREIRIVNLLIFSLGQ